MAPIGLRSEVFIEGFWNTLWLTLSAGTLGLIIGISLALIKLSTNPIIKTVSTFYLWIFRGTPLLTQILFIYYAVPLFLPFLKLSTMNAAITALTLNVGAYHATVIHAGILSIAKGQFSAALSLGLSWYKMMRLIILPQAFRNTLPSLANNFISLAKDSSLASCIGVLELSLAGNRVISETFLPVPVLIGTASLYLILTSLIGLTSILINKSLPPREKMIYDY